MNRIFAGIPVELGVALFCAVQNRVLWIAWRQSPRDRLGDLTFLIWLLPALWIAFRKPANPPRSGVPIFSVAALMMATVGFITDVNALNAVALALSVAALLPRPAASLVWLLGAVGWMPAFGWYAHFLPTIALALARLTLGVGASAWLLQASRKSSSP